MAFSALILITVMTQHFFIFLGLNLFFAVNILTHPLQALYLRCYTPGLWTTILLIIPYNVLFFYHFSKAGFLTMNAILGALIVMFFLILVFLLSHKIGEKWS
ncbi:HXXEE domain-containing protein [Salicibibacter cibi]|nr:HXXEE domain-containing protein [Salicibibacter cibi]